MRRLIGRLILFAACLGVTTPAVTLAQTQPPPAPPPITTFSVQGFQSDLFTGAATSEIPIIVPPGTAGVAPKIVLRYNSGVVDDLAEEEAAHTDHLQGQWTGLGWTLDFGGFIVRDTKGTTDTADDTFKLVFGGDTHELVSSGGGSYRAREETFWLINYVSAGDYWTVKTKDGTTHRFGFNTDSKATGLTFGPNIEVPVTFRYYIDEITTTSGTAVRYSYFKQSSSYNAKPYDQAVYPDTITYSYHSGSLVGPAREVRFIRAARNDWTDTSGSTHTSYHELSLLNSIEVRGGGGLVRKYAFGYDYSIDRDPAHTWGGGATGDLTLKTVTMFGTDGVSSLPSLTFTYTNARLASASNGIGGTVSYTYERVVTPPLYTGCVRENTEGTCVDSGATLGDPNTLLTYLVPTNHVGAATQPLVGGCARENESGCQDWWGTPNAVLGNVFTSSQLGTYPLNIGCLREFGDGGCADYGLIVNSSGADPIVGYVYAAKVDRYRVISRTLSDGLSWTSTTTFSYSDLALSSDGKDFHGHGKVRSVDPLGHYTDTFFKQDDVLKGHPYQIETRSSAGLLFSKVENTWSTTNPIPGVTFVFLSRADNYKCDGQQTCLRTAKTFSYDSFGNPTQTYHWGEIDPTSGQLVASGDERNEGADWVIDTTNWIHRLSRTTLYDSTGLVREKWLSYDSQVWGALGGRGLLTREESRESATVGQGSANNPVITHGYDAYGNKTSTTDPRGCPTTTTYDSSQTYPATVTTCLNHGTSFQYDARWGVITSQTDPNGQTTTSTYDVFGRLTKVTGPLDTTSTYGTMSRFYLDWGNPSLQRIQTFRTEQHGSGNVIWSEEYFDGLGRIDQTRQEGPGGQMIQAETTFDARGQVATKTMPHFSTEAAAPPTQFSYDVLGRQTRVTHPDGTFATTTYVHDVITLTDERGNVKRKFLDAYDRLERLEEVNGAETYATTYQYDAAGSLTRVTNHLGHLTTTTYDLLGRKIAMSDPNMGSWSYSYDLGGNLKTQTDAKGQTLTFDYDLQSRLIRKTYPDARQINWTYDDPLVPNSKGRLTRVVDLSATTNFFYDQLGRVTQTQRVIDGVTHTMAQSYDALGRVISETFPDDPQPVSYNYNEAGWLSSIPGFVNSISYNARGQKISMQYANGVNTIFKYNDPVDRPNVPPNFRLASRDTGGGAAPSPRVALNRWVKSWTTSEAAAPPTGFANLYRGGICVADGTGSCVGGDSMLESGVGSVIGYIKSSADAGTVPVYRSTCYSNTAGVCTGWGLSLDVSGTAVGYLSTTAPDAESANKPFIQSNGVLLQGLSGTASAYLWTASTQTVTVNHTDHIYNTDGTTPTGYTSEGTTGYLLQSTATGTAPLYRFVNATTGHHYYSTTTDQPAGFAQEATLGYLRTSAGSGLVALYRHYNSTTGDYLVSTVSTAPAGYVFQTALGYIYTTAGGSGGPFQNLTYGYDAVGNITTITDTLFTGGRSFTYDALNRLTQATGNFGPSQSLVTHNYSYNAIGNILEKAGILYSYGDPNHPSAVTSTSDGKSYTYDQNGNMATGGNRTYIWDPDNRLDTVTTGGVSSFILDDALFQLI